MATAFVAPARSPRREENGRGKYFPARFRAVEEAVTSVLESSVRTTTRRYAIGIVRRLDCLNISRIEGTYIRVRGRFPRYRINLNRIFSMNKRISWNLTGKRKRKRGERKIVNSRAPFFSIRESKK